MLNDQLAELRREMEANNLRTTKVLMQAIAELKQPIAESIQAQHQSRRRTSDKRRRPTSGVHEVVMETVRPVQPAAVVEPVPYQQRSISDHHFGRFKTGLVPDE